MASTARVQQIMGIPGLSVLARESTHTISLTQACAIMANLRGHNRPATSAQPILIALDMSVLLHAVFSRLENAFALVLAGDLFPCGVAETLTRVFKTLRSAGLEPVAYFDGDAAPLKAPTDQARHDARKAAREKRESGDLSLHGLSTCVRNEVSVSSATRLSCVQLCHHQHVTVKQAIHEADAQMSYDFSAGRIDAVMSVDSDYMVYDCTMVLLPAGKGVLEWTRTGSVHVLLAVSARKLEPRVHIRPHLTGVCVPVVAVSL